MKCFETTSLNKRYYKGLIKTVSDEEVDLVKGKFAELGFEEPSKLTASFHPPLLPDLIRFLATKT